MSEQADKSQVVEVFQLEDTLREQLRALRAGVAEVADRFEASAKAHRKDGGGVNSIMAEEDELLAATLRGLL